MKKKHIWYHEAISNKEKYQLKAFVKSLDPKLTLRFKKYVGGSGSYVYKTKTVVINTSYDLSIQDALSVLFHELCHYHCTQERIFTKYHDFKTDKEYLESTIKTGLRAERFVDRLAQKFMRDFFPGIRYLRGYTKFGVEWWKKVWLPLLKLQYGLTDDSK